MVRADHCGSSSQARMMTLALASPTFRLNGVTVKMPGRSAVM